MTADISTSTATGAARLSPAALGDGRAHEPLLDGAGQVVDPLLVVDLDAPADGDVVARAVRAANSSARILVGVSTGGSPSVELAAALDLTLVPSELADAGPQFAGTSDPDGHADLLWAVAATAPQAVLALARLLRAGARLDVPAALDAESRAYSALVSGAEFRDWLDQRGRRPSPPPASRPAVLTDRVDGVLHVTLNRPGRRNAYGCEMRDALVAVLNEAALDDTVERILLDGAGPSFCSGGDLDEFGPASDLSIAHAVRTRAEAAGSVRRVAGRVEARLHGSCVGAGIEVAAFAGRVVARPGTTFRLPEVGMGLIPGAGGTVSIPGRIGRWRTLLFALSGRPLDAPTALTWGLVDDVAEPSSDNLPVVGVADGAGDPKRNVTALSMPVSMTVPLPLPLPRSEE